VIRKQAPRQAIVDDVPRPVRDRDVDKAKKKTKIDEPLHVRLARLNYQLKMAR